MVSRPIAFAAFALLAAGLVAPAAAQQGQGNPVVAIVNGDSIRLSEVEDARQRLPTEYRSFPMDALYGLLLDSLIDTRVISAEARKSGLLDDPEVKSTLARIQDQVLERAYLSRGIEQRLTDAALKERYDRLVKESAGREEVRARHILVDGESQARAIISELDKGGDFEKIARERSKDGSSRDGGDLGFFGRDRMLKEFADAAFALKPGEITRTPVRTQYGWHVIRLEARRAAPPPMFEEVEGELRSEASREIGAQLIRDLRSGAAIKRFNQDGSEVK